MISIVLLGYDGSHSISSRGNTNKGKFVQTVSGKNSCQTVA